MAKGDKNKGSKILDTDKDRQPVTSDDRFKAVHNDPRFRLPQLKNFKVKVDERFSKKELRKLNASSSGKSARIDRYGRKISASEAEKDLDKFYEHEEESGEEEEDDDDDDEVTIDVDEEDKDANSESNEEEEEEARVLGEVSALDRARGEALESSSSDSEPESDSESDSESESEEESESEIEGTEEKPEEGAPTSGFAVVNMDWDNIKAVDLMATFLSFVPTGGSITSVSIYPSEFGKEQMQKEEIQGPPRELFKSKTNKKNEESDSDIDSDIELDVNNREDMEKVTRKLFEEDDGEEDYDSKALRRYQLQRLRYYYAVVKCDSVNTAKYIYDNCDGTEYESTANIFDLRYIPDDMEFEDESKDECNKIPSSYKPDSAFVTDALQHSKVKLTWDETPKERMTLSSRPLSQKEIEEMDFKAYLASDTDGSENEEETEAKDKYRNLLGGSFKFNGDAHSDGEDDVDMEITFDSGIKGPEQKEEKEGEENESTIDAYRRKEKERRQRRMAKFKGTKAAEKDESDVQENDTKKFKNKKHNNKPQIDEKSKAELELIMMDENNESKSEDHFNMRDVIKSEKQKNRKIKKSKNIDSEMTQDNFHVDLTDPRFSEVFEKHDFAIDPTNSEFKKTDTMKKILKERSNRKRGHPSNDKNQYKKSKKDSYKQKSQQNGTEVGSLVNKIKQKYRK